MLLSSLSRRLGRLTLSSSSSSSTTTTRRLCPSPSSASLSTLVTSNTQKPNSSSSASTATTWTNSCPSPFNTTTTTTTTPHHNTTFQRHFAKGKKAKKKASAAAGGSPNDDATAAQSSTASVSVRSNWLEYQRAIAGEASSGTTTNNSNNASLLLDETITPRRRRGSPNANKLTEFQRVLAERQRLMDAKGGEFPPLRYSPEETAALLAQAFAALPERAGPRRSRHYRRQDRRWFLVRQIRKKQKKHLAKAQERKMEKRSEKVAKVKHVLAQAPSIQRRDREYQMAIFQRWYNQRLREEEEEADEDDDAVGTDGDETGEIAENDSANENREENASNSK